MKTKSIWLSHVLDETTPMYGNRGKIEIVSDKSIKQGDFCNTRRLAFSTHTGSHVDVPHHFIDPGKTIDDYPPEHWVFNHVLLCDVSIEPGTLITPNDIKCYPVNYDIELLLIRTNFEEVRYKDVYWQNNPGFVPECAAHIKKHFPKVRAIGFDFISLSSYQHQEIGHEAHKKFLGADILIFEDLSLKNIQTKIHSVIALPLQLRNADGAPITILAQVDS